MASDSTDDSPVLAESDDSLAVEYTLTLADSHALYMFQFDTILRKQMRFRLQFYAVGVLKGVFLSALVGLLGWGVTVPLSSTNGRLEFALGCVGAFINLAVWLIGLIPGSFHHKSVRRWNEKRFWRALKQLRQMGIKPAEQSCRVVLTPEGFTETLESHEASDSIEITQSKVTKVAWLAVSRIEVTEKYAFFTVENANVSFSSQGTLVLPRLAFDNEASFREFVDRALSYRDTPFQTATVSPKSPIPCDSRITSQARA